MEAFLAALATLIQPAIAYAEQKLESIGAAFLGSFGLILNQLSNDERAIGANVMAFWQAHFAAAKAAGATTIDAGEQATTASLNEFVKEETTESVKIVTLITSALELAVKGAEASA